MRLLPALFLLASTALAETKPLWLACGPEALLKAIDPLAAHRRAEGMEVVTLPLAPADALAKAPRRPDFFVIVGDDDTAAPDASWAAPGQRRPYHHWRNAKKKEFVSDFAWVGLDRDGVPLVPTGRIAARTVDEAARIAAKIVAFEELPPPALALPIWAGDPAYAPEFTERFMAFLFAQTQRNGPAWMEPWVLSGDVKHPLAGPLARQAALWNDRSGRGAVFTAMIGHGDWNSFISYRERRELRGYQLDDARALREGPPRPPHLIIACNCGEFSRPGPRSLAEELLLAPGGPVLCIAATEESHPLPNFYTATSLLRQMQNSDGPARVGRLFLDAQRDARRRNEPLYELLLRDCEGRLKNGHADLERIRTDQAALYAILGDPATRVLLPHRLKVSVTKNEHGWTWNIEPPAGATRLVVERRARTQEFSPRPADATDAQAAELFERGNTLLAFQPLAMLGAGQPWHGDVAEPCILRFMAETPEGISAAGAELK